MDEEGRKTLEELAQPIRKYLLENHGWSGVVVITPHYVEVYEPVHGASLAQGDELDTKEDGDR